MKPTTRDNENEINKNERFLSSIEGFFLNLHRYEEAFIKFIFVLQLHKNTFPEVYSSSSYIGSVNK